MTSPITIMKFGGTSVADSSAIRSVARLIHTQVESGHKVIVVVSAMGGVTNVLASCARLAMQRDTTSVAELLNEAFRRHVQVAEHLLSAHRLTPYLATLVSARAEIDGLLSLIPKVPDEQRPPLLDRLLSYGEQLSAMLLAPVLYEGGIRSNYVDARSCIVTDTVHGAATPLMDETTSKTRQLLGPMIDTGLVPVLGGFIGAARDGTPTTLGRNGSDYTASLVGAATDASEIQIWTDVAGVLTADPRIVGNARTIEHLSYSEAAEISYFGAKVIFPKAIQCAAEKQIPLRICSTHAPHQGSTIISAAAMSSPGIFKSISHKAGLVLIRLISYHSLLTSQKHLSKLFESLDRHRGAIDLVDISEHNVSIVLQEDRAYPVLETLRELGSIEIVRNRVLICVIGEGLSESPGSATRIFGTLGDIKIDLISQGRYRSSVLFLVADEESRNVVQRLHQLFFSGVADAGNEVDRSPLIVAHPALSHGQHSQLEA